MGGRHAQPRQAQLAAGQHFGHHRHHLGGADVQADHQILVFLGHPFLYFLSFAVGITVVIPLSRTA